MRTEWRADAPPNLVELAVGRCLIAEMDAGRWHELGLITGTRERIQGHSRLLRSLRFGDEDYEEHVLALVPTLLGNDKAWAVPQPEALTERFPNLDTVSQYLDLPAWLALHDSAMYDRLFADTRSETTLPDGTVLSAAESAAVRLEVSEMRRQVDRIRRDYGDDPEAAIGQAKELVETACKTILGMTGDQDQVTDLPALIKKTQLHLGLDPSQVDDEIGGRATKRLLGGVASILNGAGELRNARGTGHGRSGSQLVDPTLARMAVGVVLPVVVFLIEVWEARAGDSPAPVSSLQIVGRPHPQVGEYVQHETFGEGQVVEAEDTAHGVVATVEFGARIGRRRILVHS